MVTVCVIIGGSLYPRLLTERMSELGNSLRWTTTLIILLQLHIAVGNQHHRSTILPESIQFHLYHWVLLPASVLWEGVTLDKCRSVHICPGSYTPLWIHWIGTKLYIQGYIRVRSFLHGLFFETKIDKKLSSFQKWILCALERAL